MSDRILIPIDFSATSMAAVEYGCALAVRLGAQVTLLTVFSAGIVATPDAVFAATAEEVSALSNAAQAHLRSVAEKAARSGLSIDCRAIEGFAGDMICEFAEQNAVDLIVMGTHGRRGLSHMLLGSVAEHVLRHALCPVLTVGRACAQAGHPATL
jgi:nucleotide-binding universal stress UspA family protein